MFKKIELSMMGSCLMLYNNIKHNIILYEYCEVSQKFIPILHYYIDVIGIKWSAWCFDWEFKRD